MATRASLRVDRLAARRVARDGHGIDVDGLDFLQGAQVLDDAPYRLTIERPSHHLAETGRGGSRTAAFDGQPEKRVVAEARKVALRSWLALSAA